MNGKIMYENRSEKIPLGLDRDQQLMANTNK